MLFPSCTAMPSFRIRPFALQRLFLSLVLFIALASAAIAQNAAPPDTAEAANPVELQLLLDVLRDDESRTRLIEDLERATGETEAGPVEAIDEALFGTEEMSLGRRIAETTRGIAEDTARTAGAFVSELAAAPRMFAAISAEDIDVLWETLRNLALVIVATYAIFVLLRRFAKRFYRSVGARSLHSGLIQKTLIVVVSVIVDALVVIAAWAAGYAIALVFFGELGTIGLRQTLYLNAFLVVELAKVLLRTVFSPATGDLRLIRISDPAAHYINSGFTWIISILGYGQLLLLPIFNQTVSLAAGQAVSALVSLIAVLIAVVMTLSKREAVAAWLLDTPEDRPRSKQVRSLAKRWHWPVLAYLAFLFIVVMITPSGVLLRVLGASAQIIVAVLAGFAVSGWIAGTIARGIILPERVNRRLPLLEGRLNALVPKFLTVLRAAIFITVLFFVLDTINFIDMRGWLQTQVGIRMTTSIISVFFITVSAFAIWLALNSWVDYRLNPGRGRMATSREQTLLSLMRNAATIAILVIAVMFALSEIGINIAPLIASAGVLGLAIGFGAQKLVQDIITGIFIQLENAINVGDVVTVGGITGTVERLTIRSVSLRDLEAAYHIIPFSSVDMVTNFVRGFGYHVADIGIAYREDVEDAHKALEEAFARLKADPDVARNIVGDLEWFGVVSLGESAVTVRARIKTKPGTQWGVGRAYNAAVKQIFEAHDIEIPFPHQTLFFGTDKYGNAPAAHILLDRAVGRKDSPPDEEAAEPDAGDTTAETGDTKPDDAVEAVAGPPARRKRATKRVVRDDVPSDGDENR